MKRDEKGNLVPDYGKHRKVYRTQMQMDEEERRQKLEEMRENVKKIREKRDRSCSPENNSKDDYERGLATISQKNSQGSLGSIKHRHQKYDSD